jgi:hypothetical protein
LPRTEAKWAAPEFAVGVRLALVDKPQPPCRACGRRLVQQLRARDHVSVAVQPAGTVTLVFTDIEGSTALLALQDEE